MRPLRLLLTAAAIAALGTLSSAALAAPSVKDRAGARALALEAKKAMKDKRWADAVSALKKADKLDPSPALSVDLAAALAASGKLLDARRTLAAVAAGTDAAPQAKHIRDAAKKAMADLDRRVPTVKVTVVGPAAGHATMLVDGIEVNGDEVPVNPGDHTIGAEAKGFAPAEKDVQLAEGAHEEVTLRLARRPSAAAPAAEEAQKGSRVPGAVVTSIGAAALAAGGVFGILAFHTAHKAEAQCSGDACPASAQGEITQSKTFGNVSTGLFIGGGVVAAVGIGLIIAAPGGGKSDDAPKSASARVSPWAGPDGAGLVAVGSF